MMPKLNTGQAQLEANEFASKIAKIEDEDEFLDNWAALLREKPVEGERDSYFLKNKIAEQEAIKRFGLADYLKALHKKYPDLKK